MKKKIIKEIGFCHECPHCKILPDPDPQNQSCGSDVKVVCAVNNNIVERACRPYEAKKSRNTFYMPIHKRNKFLNKLKQ